MVDGKAESKSVIAEPEVGEPTIARVIPEAQDMLVALVNTNTYQPILAARSVSRYSLVLLGLHLTGSSWLHCEETQH